VFNVVPGYGPEAGEPLALHMDVDCIGFTGSTRVGKQIHVMAGQSNLKRAWTELGGKSPNIVFADCPNLDKAVEAAVGSIFFQPGRKLQCALAPVCGSQHSRRISGKSGGDGPEVCSPANPLDTPTPSWVPSLTRYKWTRCCATSESGKSEGASLLYGGEAGVDDRVAAMCSPPSLRRDQPDMTICAKRFLARC
jgi:acyl-CoA reductase-like NAD-dependent aldehyde dehydrogenase